MSDLEELFAEAARIAERMPDRLQESAFNRALDVLLDQQGDRDDQPAQGRNSPAAPRTPSQAAPQDGVGDRVARLTQELDSTEHPEIHRARSVLERALHLLKIAREKLSIDGLTPGEIVSVLKDKFRVRVSARQVRRVLGEAGNLVDRVPEGGGYVYRIMKPGEDRLRSADSQTDNGPDDGSSRNRTLKSRRETKAESNPAEASTESDAKKRRARSATTSGIGPIERIRKLISDEWFSNPRTMNELLAELERRGASYKRTDLTRQMLMLVRAEELCRRKLVPPAGGKAVWHYENC